MVLAGTAAGARAGSAQGPWRDRLFAWLSRHIVPHPPREDPTALTPALTQLGGYFSRARRAFDLPLDMHGTGFQKAVWAELARIPYGATTSYGEIAHRLGRPRGARAVGAAVGANPLPILIPCHRVIGADGSLTGYGGGLDVKVALLRLEGVLLGHDQRSDKQGRERT